MRYRKQALLYRITYDKKTLPNVESLEIVVNSVVVDIT